MVKPRDKKEPQAQARRFGFGDALPWLLLLFFGAYVLSQLAPRAADSPFDLKTFGQLPVSAGGRIKPLDTVARSSLVAISGRQVIYQEGREIPAIQWLAEVMASTDKVHDYEIFRIDHPDILGMFGWQQEKKRFSFRELLPHAAKLDEQVQHAMETPAADRSSLQRKILELSTKLKVYADLFQHNQPFVVPPEQGLEAWTPLTQQAAMAQMNGQMNPAARQFATIIMAYSQNDPGTFNARVKEYQASLTSQMPRVVSKAGMETVFSAAKPFYHAAVIYVVVTLLCLGAWLGYSQPLNRSAFMLLALALVVHSVGLVARMYLQGRPPVTNLYSSAVFIGWAACAAALLMEYVYRNGFASLCAGFIGFATEVIAHNLSLTGDTMEMMQAVLDTNFWLATHVVTVTMGYSATYLAGILAIFYTLRGVYSAALDKTLAQDLSRMIYGSVCFATLLSFVGTVLGGIWADQSWGRFWGWDPKENGALIIVVWNALILHARWGGMVKPRGIAALSIVGNIVTAWSWFGVNELGAGLHSYGFTEGTTFWLFLFVLSQLHLLGVALLPLGAWRSFEDKQLSSTRPAAHTWIAHLNIAYSMLLGAALLVSFALPAVMDAKPAHKLYMIFSYITLALVLYGSAQGLLLGRRWTGTALAHAAAVLALGQLIAVIRLFDLNQWGWLAPLLTYPVVMLFVLNWRRPAHDARTLAHAPSAP